MNRSQFLKAAEVRVWPSLDLFDWPEHYQGELVWEYLRTLEKDHVDEIYAESEAVDKSNMEDFSAALWEYLKSDLHELVENANQLGDEDDREYFGSVG